MNPKGDVCGLWGEDPITPGGRGGCACIESSYQDGIDVVSVSGQRQGIRKISMSSKIRKLYRKHKSLHKKLLPWNYDWHREKACIDEKMGEYAGLIRNCKSGIVDHASVLRAIARALDQTEEDYMEMVEKALDKNAKLALMGSCVLTLVIAV